MKPKDKKVIFIETQVSHKKFQHILFEYLAIFALQI